MNPPSGSRASQPPPYRTTCGHCVHGDCTGAIPERNMANRFAATNWCPREIPARRGPSRLRRRPTGSGPGSPRMGRTVEASTAMRGWKTPSAASRDRTIHLYFECIAPPGGGAPHRRPDCAHGAHEIVPETSPLTSIANCNMIISICNMRDTMILLLFCFLCYPKLLAQEPSAGVSQNWSIDRHGENP